MSLFEPAICHVAIIITDVLPNDPILYNHVVITVYITIHISMYTLLSGQYSKTVGKPFFDAFTVSSCTE